MKKLHLLVFLLPLFLASSPAWANCPMMGMGPAMMDGMGMGAAMMDGPGTGGMMGHPMMGMGGMGMGGGMMGHPMMGMGGMGMGRGQQACMMQNCWHDGMGAIMPHMTVQNVFREISGYQVNAAALGLNEDQLQRLNDIKENLTALMIRTHADLQISSIDFRRAMSREKLDAAAAEKVIDRQAEMWNKLQKTAVRALADTRTVLTDQQLQQARKMAAAGPMMMQRPGGTPESPRTPPGHEQHH